MENPLYISTKYTIDSKLQYKAVTCSTVLCLVSAFLTASTINQVHFLAFMSQWQHPGIRKIYCSQPVTMTVTIYIKFNTL